VNFTKLLSFYHRFASTIGGKVLNALQFKPVTLDCAAIGEFHRLPNEIIRSSWLIAAAAAVLTGLANLSLNLLL
jgi:hypothetical protein